MGIAETHLVNDNVINVDNYEWFGNNRKHIHIRAKTGSGGVGILVKKDLLSTFKITIEDNSEDGILWITFTEIGNPYNCFYVCVVYLPPEFSARSVNAHNFFDVLMEHIYTIPNGNLFYLCGDFNSRIGDMDDFITGVDVLTERDVIDYTMNSYGEIFCEFLLNANCCVLNGRNYYHNDFTYVSTKGSSVVDYCVIPYENLRHYKNFEVKRASVICNKSAISGIFDPKHIPDHSILCWEFETNFSVEKSNSVHNNVKQNQN